MMNKSFGFHVAVGSGVVVSGLTCAIGVGLYSSGQDRREVTREGIVGDVRRRETVSTVYADAGLYQVLPNSQPDRRVIPYYEIDMIVGGRVVTIENRGDSPHDRAFDARQRLIQSARDLGQLCRVSTTDPRMGYPVLRSIHCSTPVRR